MNSDQGWLIIDLQEGFDKDTVVVFIDGEEVFRKDLITTLRMLGFAESKRVPLTPGDHEIKVSVPSRGLAHTATVDVQGETYLGVSLRSEGIHLVSTREPFGYA